MTVLDQMTERYPVLWDLNLMLLEDYWEPMWEILGDDATVFPLVGLGDDGLPTDASFKTRRRHANGLEAVATWQETDGGPAYWTNSNNYSNPDRWQGVVPIVSFDGVNDMAATPDDDYWTTTATNLFSVGAWIRVLGYPGHILAKFDANTSARARELLFLVEGNGKAALRVYDETNDAIIGRLIDTPLTPVWTFIVGTYDGGTDAANISIYKDGAQADDADFGDDVAFASMVNSDSLVTLGCRLGVGATSDPDVFYDGSMAGGPLGLFFVPKELTLAEIVRLTKLGQAALGVEVI